MLSCLVFEWLLLLLLSEKNWNVQTFAESFYSEGISVSLFQAGEAATETYQMQHAQPELSFEELSTFEMYVEVP